jgi:maltose phosphorylase
MKGYYKLNEWNIIEEGFHPEMNRESESIFSLGNGYMGQRANFEEHYSGDSLRGSYVAGVYYPDKTRVGWWKNGYPEYFAKVLNAPNWIGIDVSVNGKAIDLATTRIISFTRILNMKEGYLERSFKIFVSRNKTIEINTRRFLSMAEPDLGIIRYSVNSVDFAGKLNFTVYIDADVKNEDANYGKKFWEEVSREVKTGFGIITSRTMKTDFHVATGMCYELAKDNKKMAVQSRIINRGKYIANSLSIRIEPGEKWTICKYVSVLSSLNNPEERLNDDIKLRLREVKTKGYDKLFKSHTEEWKKIWAASDVVIEGDLATQQAIRFNIFHINQTYTGKDERLNIVPKGFTV